MSLVVQTSDPIAAPAPPIPPASPHPLVHLLDIERAELAGKIVATDVMIAGIGEVFLAPSQWAIECHTESCAANGKIVTLASIDKDLLAFAHKTDDQSLGIMRRLAGCAHKGRVTVQGHVTLTELVVMPLASAAVGDGAAQRDFRDKLVTYVGALTERYAHVRATGEVVAEPRRQRASMLVTRLTPLQSATDQFTMTADMRAAFTRFEMPSLDRLEPEAALEQAVAHLQALTKGITRRIVKIYGAHRETLLLAELLALHSPAEIRWDGEPMKGVLDLLVIGDSGQGKTTGAERLLRAIGLGSLASCSSSSRAGVLYSLDSKVNDKRILTWGAYPLAHGTLLVLDEAQQLLREEWAQFTSARSEGVLRVNRAIRAEHPSRVRLIAFANPINAETMAGLQFGIAAVRPSKGGFLAPKDLRRFDIVVCVTEGDQSLDDQVPPKAEDGIDIEPAALRESVLWAWTRRPNHVRFTEAALETVKKVARKLVAAYGHASLPVMIAGDSTDKVARLAAACAAFVHSTDPSHETVIVHPIHVLLIGDLLESVYDHPSALLGEYVQQIRRGATLGKGEYERILENLTGPGSNRDDVSATEAMLDLFLTEEVVSRSDIASVTGLQTDAVSRRIGKLRTHKLINTARHGYAKNTRFITFLRRWSRGAASNV